jgi:hypothetical protein
MAFCTNKNYTVKDLKSAYISFILRIILCTNIMIYAKPEFS